MKSAFRVITLSSLAFCTAAVSASDNCIDVTGEINNNAVNVVYPNEAVATFPQFFFYTMGVADVKVTLPDLNKPKKLNCTLLGEPTGAGIIPDAPAYQYEHLLVCNDVDQSEIAFQTYQTAEMPSEDVIEDTCYSDPSTGLSIPFVENAVVNTGRRQKGLFYNVNGSAKIEGCVNIVDQVNGVPIFEINMAVVDTNICYAD